jgi:hypothetical protein
MVTPKAVHVQLKLSGTPRQIAEFHQLMKFVDGDWPFTKYVVREEHCCGKCKGLIYNSPRLGTQEIKSAAKQVGLKGVKIRRFAEAKACEPTRVVPISRVAEVSA